jgi:DNA-binding transcriptional ArsR family regulator
MTESKTEKEGDSPPDPHLKEQDKGIIEAFAREDHRVLTNSEISEHVSLSDRQVRRRLDKLADQGIIGKRVVSGVKMAWLEEDVKEPITVQYPLLTYVRDRASVQLFLIGILGGIVAVLILLGAAISIGYNVPVGFVSREQLLVYGVLAATVSALFMIVAAMMAVIGKLMRYYGIDVESQIQELRD